jgi:hypothetical protein
MIITWKYEPTRQHLAIFYLIGFLSCLVTQIVVAVQKGPTQYVNLLFALLLPFQEWIRQVWQSFVGPTTPGKSPLVISVIGSSALIGLFFPSVVSLMRYKAHGLRLLGYVLLLLLALMTLCWWRFPNVL